MHARSTTCLLGLLSPLGVLAQTSESFVLQGSVIATAGGQLESESFVAVSTLSEPSASGEMSSESFEAQGGILAVEIPIAIDVMPGDQNNPINNLRRGRTPVAILSSLEFDATQDIDLASLTFGRTGREQSLANCAGGGEDVNDDGILDQVCHFHTDAAGLAVGDIQIVLRGRLRDSGTDLVGTDSVVVAR